MSFALYGESLAYVYLFTADTREEVLESFLQDVEDTGEELATITNIYGVQGGKEDTELEDSIREMIKAAKELTKGSGVSEIKSGNSHEPEFYHQNGFPN
jgi:hypothetical protein